MPEITKEQFLGLYELAPQELKDVLSSDRAIDFVEAASHQQKLNEKQLSAFVGLVGEALVGLLPPSQFEEALVKRAKIEKESAQKISRAIRRLIFYPVREIINDLYQERLEIDAGKEGVQKEVAQEALDLFDSNPQLARRLLAHFPQVFFEEFEKKEEKIVQGLQKKLVPKGVKDKEAKELVEKGVVSSKNPLEVVRKTALKKVVKEMRPNHILYLDQETKINPGFQEMVVRYQTTAFIKKMVEQEDKVSEGIRNKLAELGPDHLIKTNPRLGRSLKYSRFWKSYLAPQEKKEREEKPIEKNENLLEREIESIKSGEADQPETPDPLEQLRQKLVRVEARYNELSKRMWEGKDDQERVKLADEMKRIRRKIKIEKLKRKRDKQRQQPS